MGYEHTVRSSTLPVFDYTVNRFWILLSWPRPSSLQDAGAVAIPGRSASGRLQER